MEYNIGSIHVVNFPYNSLKFMDFGIHEPPPAIVLYMSCPESGKQLMLYQSDIM